MKRTTAFLAAIAFCALCSTVHGIYSVSDKGTWPRSWPKELEPLRKQSRTLEGPIVLNRHYAIPFTKQAEFEAAWPHILKVKTKGAPVILVRGPTFFLGDNHKAGVVVHSPPAGAKDPEAPIGSQINTRVPLRDMTYIELIVDGEIVDLNRIRLPADTPIIDKRFNGGPPKPDARKPLLLPPPAPIPQYLTSVAFSPDGKTIAAADFANKVRLWDRATGKQVAVLKGAGDHVTFSPDGKFLACSSSGGFGVQGLRPEGVKLFDRATGKQTATLEDGGITSIAFSPDGETLACARISVRGHGKPPVISFWKLATGKNTSTITVADHNGCMVHGIAFDPDGTTLATCGASNDLAKQTPEVKLWDVASGKNLRSFTGHTGFVLCVAFSRDGKLLASGSNDHSVRLWNVATGKKRAKLAGHTAPVYCVAFSPNGKMLATTADDKTVRLWDPATGKNFRTLHTDYVRSVAFSPDSQTLVSGESETANGNPTAVKLWDVASGKNTKTFR